MHNPKPNPLMRMFRLGTTVLIPTGLMVLSLPQAVNAAWNPFEICSLELIEENISPEEAAIACAEAIEPTDLSLCVLRINTLTPVDAKSALRACFRDRRPLEMANCAIDITQEIEKQQLSSQYDAEPIEIEVDENIEANVIGESEDIVINIQPGTNLQWQPGGAIELQTGTLALETDTAEAHSQTILDRCRRSLLPERFAECVIGLRREANLPTDRALKTCIEAEDFPPSLFPTSAQ